MDEADVVPMHGFTGSKTAPSEELPGAVAVTDLFHVVCLVGDAPSQVRRRVLHAACRRRGARTTRSMQRGARQHRRRAAHRGAASRLEALFAVSEHAEVEATCAIYQRMIAAYCEPGKKHGKAMINSVT